MALQNLINQKKELITRALSSLILAPLVLYIIYLGGILYIFLIVTMAVLMAFEWNTITSTQQHGNKAAILWKLFGLFYIVMPCAALLWLRDQDKGLIVIMWMLGVVWATDIAAYFGGNIIGGWKLCPPISPNKTWSGLISGVAAGYFIGCLAVTISNPSKPQYLISLSVILAIYAQIGDLVESWIKRKCGVKDSGHVIPGHGGILDRVDSIVPVAPKVAIVLLFDKWGIF